MCIRDRFLNCVKTIYVCNYENNTIEPIVLPPNAENFLNTEAEYLRCLLYTSIPAYGYWWSDHQYGRNRAGIWNKQKIFFSVLFKINVEGSNILKSILANTKDVTSMVEAVKDQNNRIIAYTNGDAAVSYTHLDVYKRQS